MLGIVGLLTAGLLMGPGAQAQAIHVPGMGTAAEQAADTTEAAELERQARALFSQRDEWRKAARLLERAADLRSPEEPQRATNLMLAARIHGYLRNNARAERLITVVAHEAHARGAVMTAAQAYLEAADFALLRGERARAVGFADRAALLAGSPHLTAAERASIMARLPQERHG